MFFSFIIHSVQDSRGWTLESSAIANKTFISIIINKNLLYLRISVVVFISQTQVQQYEKVVSHCSLSFPADQRARHHHGRGAGVRHPAQHDRKAAV